MSIWFYLCIIILFITSIISIKYILLKLSLNKSYKDFELIINSDTNNLLTISCNDKNLKEFINKLNKNLKKLRKLELEYNQGNINLKHTITNISHDLRTPLTAIKGYLDILDKKNFTKEQIKYFNIINTKVNDLVNLTEELFNYSKILDKAYLIKKEQVCLNIVLEEVFCSYYDLFKNNNIIPKIDITSNKIIKEIDLICFKRIIENIISNLLKYSNKSIYIKLDNTGSITFINKTKKLDKVSVGKIFDRYFTVESSKKSNGIGLSIAKELVILNNGEITAKYINNKLIIKIVFK